MLWLRWAVLPLASSACGRLQLKCQLHTIRLPLPISSPSTVHRPPPSTSLRALQASCRRLHRDLSRTAVLIFEPQHLAPPRANRLASTAFASLAFVDPRLNLPRNSSSPSEPCASRLWTYIARWSPRPPCTTLTAAWCPAHQISA